MPEPAERKKKLIEVGLPLETINRESAREKSIRHGHPSTLHLWWARRPLATARAVLFAQLVDDPSSHPEQFPTQAAQDAERTRLHQMIEAMVVWENTAPDYSGLGTLQGVAVMPRDHESHEIRTRKALWAAASEEIRRSNGGELPAVLDPFAGGGSIPLEAQRLGLEAHASDLNPVAVLINKALIEIPPKFAGRPPVHPGAEDRPVWYGAQGLAEDVRYYGQWMRDEAFKRIGHLYPKVKDDNGVERTVIAWIWARTVRSPNPANPIEVPLVRSWWLGKRKGKEAWIRASVVDGQVRYKVMHDAIGPKGDDDWTIKNGRGAKAVGDATPFTYEYVRSEGKAGRMATHLIAIVGEGDRERVYMSPTADHIEAATVARPSVVDLDSNMADNPRWFSPPQYGLTRFSELFTNRQLVAMTTFSDLVVEARDKVQHDQIDQGIGVGAGTGPYDSCGKRFDDSSESRNPGPAHRLSTTSYGSRLEEGGDSAAAYADAVATYLACIVSKFAARNCSLCTWENGMDRLRGSFQRQAIPMTWDFAEANPLENFGGGFEAVLTSETEVLLRLEPHAGSSSGACQVDAATGEYTNLVISTDPPYYDNIGYSDLSDFFYVWLRHSLAQIQSNLVTTVLTPKADELVANPYRHNGRQGAGRFFVDGFNRVFRLIRQSANSFVPMTVYYAYKQQDTDANGSSSTGWTTLLDGLLTTGWEITATWPMHSELGSRMLASGSNALASSIVLACRPRPKNVPSTTRRQLLGTLKSELPGALRAMMQGAVAPVDLAQAAIGPGMSIFSRYSFVREADGSTMSVRDALMLINATLDEVIDEQESDFDADTRFAVKWYRTYGWATESSGTADTLSRATGTSPAALERGGIFEARGGKARLRQPKELESAWDPVKDDRVSIWEATVRLAAIMDKQGQEQVAQLLPGVETRVHLDQVKELGFLLFHEAERKGNAQDALLFNGLVSAWNDIGDQARRLGASQRATQDAFDFGGDA